VDVGVAGGVDVAHRPVHPLRHLQPGHLLGGQEVAGAAGLDPGVAGLAQQDRQPARL